MVPTFHPVNADGAGAPRQALLLMRQTPAQVFCANTLFHAGVIDCVYIEAGSTGEPDSWAMVRRLWRYGPLGIGKRISRDLQVFGGRFKGLLGYYLTRLRTRGLMGRQARHEDRVLGPFCRQLDPRLRVVRGQSVNDPPCSQLICQGGYRLVFVFGTGLLRDGLLGLSGTTFVNLHHGWLPRFRGEGIIAALAEEGIDGLGVTVHLVDRGVDTGPILYRERLILEPGDNAYAVALKATRRGVSLFHTVYQDAQRGPLRGMPQDPAVGRLYSAKTLTRAYQMRVTAARSLRAIDAPRAPRSRATRLAAEVAVASGVTVLSRKRHGRRLRILMYHGVVPRVSGPAALGNLFLDEAAFARQMGHLRRAFCVISLDEALTRLQTEQPFPECAVVITLDDGYRNVLATALPVLRRYGLPAAVFLPSAQVDERSCSWFDVLRVLVVQCANERTTIRLTQDLAIDGRFIRSPERTFRALSLQMTTLPPDQAEPIMARLVGIGQTIRLPDRCPEFALAGWDEWRDAMAGGLITVGSHGTRHRNLRQLSATDCVEELRRSKERIEERLSRVPSTDRKMNAFVRFFLGGAVEVVPDKQGRILVPPSLRSYAGLEKEVVILGMPNRFEIWSLARWQDEIGRFEKEVHEDPGLAREISALGI